MQQTARATDDLFTETLRAGQRRRDGTLRLERMAVRQTEAALAAIPGEILYRYAIWPEPIASVCVWAGLRDADANRALSGSNGRPYDGQRTLLAQRIGLSRADLDEAIDFLRPRISDLPGAADRQWTFTRPRRVYVARRGTEDEERRPRTGEGRLERLALERVRRNVAAMKPGMVLQLAIFPFHLRDLAAQIGCETQGLSNLFAYARSHGGRAGLSLEYLRNPLAEALEVTRADLDLLLETPPGEGAEPLPAPPPPSEEDRRALGITARRR